MSRERTGTLLWRASGWRGIVTVDELDAAGKPVTRRVPYNLDTKDKATAKRRLAKIVRDLAEGNTPQHAALTASAPDTLA